MGLVTVIVGAVVGVIGHLQAKAFVRRRLSLLIDAVDRPGVAMAAGAVAGIVALPAVVAIPFVGLGAAVLAGVGVATGVRAGVREVREGGPGGGLAGHLIRLLGGREGSGPGGGSGR